MLSPPPALNLQDLAVTRRADAWSRWVAAHFPGFRVASMQPTPGRGEMFELGPARLWHLQSPARVALRGHDSRIASGYTALFLQVSGTTTFRVGARENQLAPGELVIGGGGVASNFAIEHSEDVEHLILAIPSDLLNARHPRFVHAPRIHRASEPGVQLLGEALKSAARDVRKLDADQINVLLGALVQLAGLPRLPTAPNAAEEDQRVRRAMRMISEQLHDPELNAPRIADACSLGRRRLDQLFVQATTMSVSACILEARLARAAELLADPAHHTISITEIAHATGFNEAAQFSRAFRVRFDATPRTFRQAKLAKLSSLATPSRG